MGGLPRRATVIESLAGEAPVVVDAGDSLSVRDLQGDVGAALIKAEVVAEAWAASGIDGVAISARDWTLGSDAVRALIDANGLPVLAANLTCGGERPYPGHKVVERRGKRVGIVGVTAGQVDGCTVGDAATALREAATALGQVDLTIALLPVERQALRGLKDLPVDLVVMTASSARLDLGAAVPVTPSSRGKTLMVGRVALHEGATGLWSAPQQKTLAEEVDRLQGRAAEAKADLAAASDKDRAMRERRLTHFERQLGEARQSLAAYGSGEGRHTLGVDSVELDDKIADNPIIAEKVRTALARLEARTPVVAFTGPRVVQIGPFAGADACKECHPAEYAQWLATPHARAYASLVADGHGSDPTCVECHVTGWRAQGGVSTVPAIEPFRDVQCETCHGPGRAHGADPTGVEMSLGADLETCTGCHDGDRDGGRFDHATYRPRILHAGAPTP